MDKACIEYEAIIKTMRLGRYLNSLASYGQSIFRSAIIKRVINRIHVDFNSFGLVDQIKWALNYSLETHPNRFK
jgi:hypothetical protein